MKTVASAIANALIAASNCQKNGNTEWWNRWNEYLLKIEKECLPSGSGIDNGTSIFRSKHPHKEFKLDVRFHHMNDVGYYVEWKTYTISVVPAWDGIDLVISGRDKYDIHDYLYDIYYTALTKEAPQFTA